jgi:hypothetical protein
MISVRVPPKGTRWRVKIACQEVDPEEWGVIKCFGPEKSFMDNFMEHLRRPERVQYLPPKSF